jgi:hypothetical protein
MTLISAHFVSDLFDDLEPLAFAAGDKVARADGGRLRTVSYLMAHPSVGEFVLHQRYAAKTFIYKI